MFQSVYPFTGQVLAEHPVLSESQVNDKLHASSAAFNEWSSQSLQARIEVIRKAHDILEQRADQVAETITWEMGKPISQARAEVDKSLWLMRDYCSQTRQYLATSILEFEDIYVQIRRDPLGTILGIMPWNFPLWQTMRYAVPSVLAGNAVFLKPAANVCQTAFLIEELFQQATGGMDILLVLCLEHDQVERVIASDVVQGVTLTGSARAGRQVASLAGKYLKKSVMELGGSDPFIVLPDAEIGKAAEAFVQSRMNNTGQTCIAAKRALVHRDIYQEFRDAVVSVTSSLNLNEPFNEQSDITCLARADLAEGLQRQIDQTKESGATILLQGGQRNNSTIVTPVIFENVDLRSPAWTEEIFGPVITLMEFRDDDQAVKFANDTEYGLGASIWSADNAHARALASSIRAGSIHINRIVSSDPRVPFGGIKASGYGHELGREGILEFTNLKTITANYES